jgi:hypothetical protein
MTATRDIARRRFIGIGVLALYGVFSTTLALMLAQLALSAAPAAAATCPNEALREAQTSEAFPEGTAVLPQCMALEMVSPAKKFNQRADTPQLSADGERIVFQSLAALAGTPRQGSLFDRYVASRGAGGWHTQSTAPPPEIIAGSLRSALPCSFTPDLSRWALWGSTSAQGPVGITTAFQGGLGGFFSPLGPTMAPISGNDPAAVGGGRCEGASLDISHFYFAISSAIGIPKFSYLPGDPVVGVVDRSHVYEAYLDEGIPTLRLLQRDHTGVVYGGSCGVSIGLAQNNEERRRGAVSPDASRIYFSANLGQPAGSPCDPNAHPLRIMRRLETPAGPEIAELVANECTRVAPPCSSVNSGEIFQGASQEGGRVYFTTTRQLANSDLDATNDLYLHDSSQPEGSRLTQVSAGDGTAPTPGEGAKVLGLSDFSGDGSHAYFVAEDVLTTAANAAGDTAQAGERNLYLYQRDAEFPSGRTVFVATLAAGEGGSGFTAVPLLGPDFEGQSVGGDGHLLVFVTAAALTPDDADGGHRDLYRYDADMGAIERVTKAAPGGQDNGPFNAGLAASRDRFGGPQGVSFGRSVSEDGETIAFNTAEQLDPADPSGGVTPHIWHEGEVSALPFSDGSVVETMVSMSGEEVAFVSPKSLLPEDGDGATDVYVARADGGFPPLPPPVPCVGEACQEPFVAAPSVQGTSSQATTLGNVKSTPCKRGTVRRRGRCVRKRPARKAKQRQAKKKRQANRSQGGSK